MKCLAVTDFAQQHTLAFLLVGGLETSALFTSVVEDVGGDV